MNGVSGGTKKCKVGIIGAYTIAGGIIVRYELYELYD